MRPQHRHAFLVGPISCYLCVLFKAHPPLIEEPTHLVLRWIPTGTGTVAHMLSSLLVECRHGEILPHLPEVNDNAVTLGVSREHIRLVILGELVGDLVGDGSLAVFDAETSAGRHSICPRNLEASVNGSGKSSNSEAAGYGDGFGLRDVVRIFRVGMVVGCLDLRQLLRAARAN